jgi:hypothetical protein
MYTAWDHIIQIEYIFSHVFCRSLVLIQPVFHVHRVYRGSFFLLSTDSTYSRIPEDKGGPLFFQTRIFLALVLRTNWCTTI